MTNEEALEEIYRLVTRQIAETPRGPAGDTAALVEISAICEERNRVDVI